MQTAVYARDTRRPAKLIFLGFIGSGRRKPVRTERLQDHIPHPILEEFRRTRQRNVLSRWRRPGSV